MPAAPRRPHPQPAPPSPPNPVPRCLRPPALPPAASPLPSAHSAPPREHPARNPKLNRTPRALSRLEVIRCQCPTRIPECPVPSTQCLTPSTQCLTPSTQRLPPFTHHFLLITHHSSLFTHHSSLITLPLRPLCLLWPFIPTPPFLVSPCLGALVSHTKWPTPQPTQKKISPQSLLPVPLQRLALPKTQVTPRHDPESPVGISQSETSNRLWRFSLRNRGATRLGAQTIANGQLAVRANRGPPTGKQQAGFQVCGSYACDPANGCRPAARENRPDAEPTASAMPAAPPPESATPCTSSASPPRNASAWLSSRDCPCPCAAPPRVLRRTAAPSPRN